MIKIPCIEAYVYDRFPTTPPLPKKAKQTKKLFGSPSFETNHTAIQDYFDS